MHVCFEWRRTWRCVAGRPNWPFRGNRQFSRCRWIFMAVSFPLPEKRRFPWVNAESDGKSRWGWEPATPSGPRSVKRQLDEPPCLHWLVARSTSWNGGKPGVRAALFHPVESTPSNGARFAAPAALFHPVESAPSNGAMSCAFHTEPPLMFALAMPTLVRHRACACMPLFRAAEFAPRVLERDVPEPAGFLSST